MELRDLTLGNYCNIDLVYPRNPSLNRAKRYSAITQAQVAFSHGDRVVAENVRFMARLNLCNLNGTKRALFLNCHTESTDDSLNGGGVYLNCTSDFYGTQPFGGTTHRYGTGINGAVGYGLLQNQQGARLRYTPVGSKFGDMDVTWVVDPSKLGGQGFASAKAQYLDLFIKFDTATLTGYALRVIRTTKFADAVDVEIVKYTNGIVEVISEAVSTDCFHTGTVLNIRTEGNKLIAHAEGYTAPEYKVNDPRIHGVVDIEAPYTPNNFGGIGLQHTSTVGWESKMMIHSVKAIWK